MRSILKCILCLHHHLHLFHMALRNPDSHPSLLLPVLIFTPAALLCPLSRHPPPPPPPLPTCLRTPPPSAPQSLCTSRHVDIPSGGESGSLSLLACQGCFLLTLCCWCVQSSSMCYYMTCQRTSRRSTEMSVTGSLSYAKLRLANSFQVVFYLLLFQRAVLLHLIALLISENGVNFLQKKRGGGRTIGFFHLFHLF